MSLENNIKEWVKLDSKQSELNNELKIIRDQKNNYSLQILNFFHEKQISNPTINITGGKINLIDQKTANPLTYKFLNDCFKEFFKDKKNGDELSDQLLSFIKDKRIYSCSKNLKRINV